MFCMSTINICFIFFVSLKYIEIITVKIVTLYFFMKSLKNKKEVGINFVLLCQSKNMVGQFKKAYLHRPIIILHFLTPARIRKYFT